MKTLNNVIFIFLFLQQNLFLIKFAKFKIDLQTNYNFFEWRDFIFYKFFFLKQQRKEFTSACKQLFFDSFSSMLDPQKTFNYGLKLEDAIVRSADIQINFLILSKVIKQINFTYFYQISYTPEPEHLYGFVYIEAEENINFKAFNLTYKDIKKLSSSHGEGEIFNFDLGGIMNYFDNFLNPIFEELFWSIIP